MRVFLVLMFLLAVPVLSIKSSDIQLSVLKYEPVPAEPGAGVKVWLAVANKGESADTIRIAIVPRYPFKILDEEEFVIKSIPALEDKVLEFNVLTDVNSPNGVSNLTLEYRSDFYQDAWTRIEFPITIRSSDAAVVLDSYTSQPSYVVPGREANITLNFRNNGKASARSVDVFLNAQDSPFSVLGSGSKRRISSIQPGETQSIVFRVISNSDALIKVYKLPLVLSYKDVNGQKYNDSSSLSVVANAPPVVDIGISSISADDSSKPTKVGIKFVNKGISNLKYVSLSLLQSEDYEILSPSSTVYLGNIDTDDFETAEFIILSEGKQVVFNVLAEFLDEYNKEHKISSAIPVRIYTAGELSGKSSWWVLVLVVLVAIGVYWYFRKK
ncbi:hypothetical protein HY486_01880 [Candidatus Woesearchaeota archaeon]|nr:hypothetical protein [Candidatus Woesearchaeota archaeon]